MEVGDFIILNFIFSAGWGEGGGAAGESFSANNPIYPCTYQQSVHIYTN